MPTCLTTLHSSLEACPATTCHLPSLRTQTFVNRPLLLNALPSLSVPVKWSVPVATAKLAPYTRTLKVVMATMVCVLVSTVVWNRSRKALLVVHGAVRHDVGKIV